MILQPQKCFDQKNISVKFWFKGVSEEIILQPEKNFDQKIFHENFGSKVFPRK